MTASPRFLEWDSAFFGVPIARADASTADDVAAIDEWAVRESARCMYMLVSMNALCAIQAAERRGFFLTTVRSTYQTRAPFSLASSEDLVVRSAVAADLGTLKAIASRAHGETRFYKDPHFSRDDCDRLYITWIERSCNGWADQVLVADVNGAISGYITLHRSEGDRGSIGLFAVAESARGAGVGRVLIAAGLRWFESIGVKSVTVATQAHNVAALRAYQRAGFVASAVDVWMHKWW